MEYDGNIIDSMEQLANAIACCILFCGLNLFDSYNVERQYCPRYCDVHHQHNFDVVAYDKAPPKKEEKLALLDK
jgi:hypothetical protein